MVLRNAMAFKSHAENDVLENLWPSAANDSSSSQTSSHASRTHEPRILMEGYLSKEGINVKNWKLRYVTLFDDALAYYAAPSDTSASSSAQQHALGHHQNPRKLKLKKRIPLKRGQLVAKAPERSLTKDFCFKLITHQRCYYFVAPNEAVRMEWINAIKDALLNLPNDEENVMVDDPNDSHIDVPKAPDSTHTPSTITTTLPVSTPSTPLSVTSTSSTTLEDTSHRSLASIIHRFPSNVVDAFKKEHTTESTRLLTSPNPTPGKNPTSKPPVSLPLEAFHNVLLHQSHLLMLKIPGTFYFLNQYLLFYSKVMSKETALYFPRDTLNFIEKVSDDSFYLRVLNQMTANVKHLFSVPELEAEGYAGEDDHVIASDKKNNLSSSTSVSKSTTLSSPSRFSMLMRLFKQFYSMPIIERQLQSDVHIPPNSNLSTIRGEKRKRKFHQRHASHSSNDTDSYLDEDTTTADDTVISSDEEDETLDEDTASEHSRSDTAADIFGVATSTTSHTPLPSSNHKLSFFHLNLHDELYINEKFREAFNPLYKSFNKDVFVPNIPADEIIQFRFYCTFEDSAANIESQSSLPKVRSNSHLTDGATYHNQPTMAATTDNAPTRIASNSGNLLPSWSHNMLTAHAPNLGMGARTEESKIVQYGQAYITNSYLWFHGRTSPFSPIVKWVIPFTTIESFHYKSSTIRIRVFSQSSAQFGEEHDTHPHHIGREEYFLHMEDETTTNLTQCTDLDSLAASAAVGDFFISTSLLSEGHDTLPDNPHIFTDLQDLSSQHFELQTLSEVRVYRILVHLHNAFYKTNPPIDCLFPFRGPLLYESLSSRIKLSPHVDGVSSYVEYSTNQLKKPLLQGGNLMDTSSGRSTMSTISDDSKSVRIIADYFSVENAEKREQEGIDSSQSIHSTPRSAHKFKIPSHCSIIDQFALYCFRAWGKQRVHLIIYQNYLNGEMIMQLTPVGKTKSIKRASFRTMSCILRDPKNRDRFYISFGAKRWKFSESNQEQLQRIVTVLDKIHKQAKEMSGGNM